MKDIKPIAIRVSIVISALIAIFFRYSDIHIGYAIFKPITTVLILLMAARIYYKQEDKYSKFVTIALVFSLIGDIFLIGDNYFLYGLGSFFLAHITFIIAFTQVSGFLRNIPTLLILTLFGVLYYAFLYPNLGDYSIPVAVYIAVLLMMSWQAISLAIRHKLKVFILLAVASLLFSFSDGVIAYNKFVEEFYASGLLILSTYWLAIYTFAVAGIEISKKERYE